MSGNLNFGAWGTVYFELISEILVTNKYYTKERSTRTTTTFKLIERDARVEKVI